MTTDFNDYPNMPFSHRVIIRELDGIISEADGNPAFIAWCTAMRSYFLEGSAEYEDVVGVAQEIGYRLPAFKDDYVGYPADDED